MLLAAVLPRKPEKSLVNLHNVIFTCTMVFFPHTTDPPVSLNKTPVVNGGNEPGLHTKL